MRLDFGEYERAASLARGAGFKFVESHFDEQGFGNWRIVLAKAGDVFRIIFDGREGWLLLQRWSDDNWSDIWIERQPSSQPVDDLIAQLTDVHST